MDSPLTWSPPSSPYQNAKERAFTQSVLTYSDGVLEWSPAGMRRSAVGGCPWSVRVGPGPDEASQLVWIDGVIAPARGGPLRASVVAVTATDPTGPGGRRVLGYLPANLVRPYMGGADPVGTHDVTAHMAETIAGAVGLAYAEFEPQIGVDLGKTFPGAVRHSRFIAVSPWLNAVVAFAAGTVFLVIGLSGLAGAPSRANSGIMGIAIFVAIMGVLIIGMSIVVTPPVFVRMKQRGERRAESKAI